MDDGGIGGRTMDRQHHTNSIPARVMLGKLDTSGLKSKKEDSFRLNFEKKLNFSPDVSNYPSTGTALCRLSSIPFHPLKSITLILMESMKPGNSVTD